MNDRVYVIVYTPAPTPIFPSLTLRTVAESSVITLSVAPYGTLRGIAEPKSNDLSFAISNVVATGAEIDAALLALLSVNVIV